MLRLPVPEHQVIPLNLALDTYKSVSFKSRKDFPPHYNGGVVYAPWASNLGRIWRKHMILIRIISTGIFRRFVYMGAIARYSNQPSLATSIAYLKQNGFRFKLLPDEYNARWQHMTTGALTTQKVRIYHALYFGQGDELRNASAKEAMDAYHAFQIDQYNDVRSHREMTEDEKKPHLG